MDDKKVEFQERQLEEIRLGSASGVDISVYAKPEYNWLQTEQIRLGSQIVGVAHAYDALATERIYKEAYDRETAYTMIINGERGAFSSKLMTAFKVSKLKFEQQLDIYTEHTAEQEDEEEYVKNLELEEELKDDLFDL